MKANGWLFKLSRHKNGITFFKNGIFLQLLESVIVKF